MELYFSCSTDVPSHDDVKRLRIYRVRFFPVRIREDASIRIKKISSFPASTKTGLSEGRIWIWQTVFPESSVNEMRMKCDAETKISGR